PQYLGRSWTGCGPRLRVLGAKNRTEPDLKTLLVRVSSTIIYPAAARRGVRADQQVVRGGCEVWVQGEFVLLSLPIAIYD
ncbi:hypothetical protein K443DRAFT_110971, partial [Laccaria amethystina LaAM-08-1]